MKRLISAFALLWATCGFAAEVRLLDLEPTDAQQYIDKQDQTLKYAPKVDSNVPAVRFLGNEPHNVLEDIYLANQYHGQDGLGGYLYGYSVPDIAKTEKKKAGGDLRGAYNYINGDGQEIKVEYWDDGNGFHQIDNVPQIQPQQVEDTPEVKAAKEEHARIWQEQAERNSKPIADPNANYQPYQQQPQQQQQQHQQPQQQYQQPQQQHQQPQQQYQQPQQQHQQPQQQYQQPQQQHQQPQQQYQQPQQQHQQPQQQYQQPQQQHQQQPQQQQPQQQHQQQNQPPQQQHQQPQQQQQLQPYSNLVNQYQQQKNQFPNPGQPVQYQGDESGQYYEGQQSQAVSKYQQPEQHGQGQAQGDQQNYGQGQAKQYRQEDEEENNGPPKGFFYSFDYPVGIIVQKQGGVQKREGDLKDVYATNKANFEQQLHGTAARPARSSNGYLYVQN